MNMNVVREFRKQEIVSWAQKYLASEAQVVSDSLACFTAVETVECEHTRIVTGSESSSVTHEEFTWVNTMIGNVKKAILGV